MGYYKTSLLPLYPVAKEFTLCDHFFHSAFGSSFLNHQWLIAAATPSFPDAPQEIRAVLDADGKMERDGLLTPEGYAVIELKSSDAGAFRPEAVVQLALYMYAFEKMYNVRPTKGVLESIASGKQRVITMSDELMQDCENLIVAAMLLLQSNTFPATPSLEQCGHCSFRDSCSMAEK